MNSCQDFMVEECLPMARALAHKYYTMPNYRFSIHAYDYDDLVSEANVALVRAAQNYDETRGVKFSTVAFRYIVNQLSHTYERSTAKLYSEDVYLSDPGCDEEDTLRFIGDDGIEAQCVSEVYVEDFMAGLKAKEAYLLKLLLEGRSQPDCAKKMAERFGHCTQEAVSYLRRRISQKFSEFYTDDDASASRGR